MENDADYCRAQAQTCVGLANLISAEDVRACLLEKGGSGFEWLISMTALPAAGGRTLSVSPWLNRTRSTLAGTPNFTLRW